MNLFYGFLLGILIGLLAWRAGALSRSGAWAAAITGGLIFGIGGLAWAILLMTFFVSSSALSRAFASRKRNLSEKFSKGSQRDWHQVFANGGLGALFALVYVFCPEQTWIWIAFAGAMATVNADTWGTELGVLNPTPPRLVTNGKCVERGTSGAVSLIGSLSVFGGAALIALIAAGFTQWKTGDGFLIALLAVTLGGFGGAFFDSLLGATVQAIYYCPSCEKETERSPLHTCGTNTNHLRGWLWLENDMVNFVASLFGALVSTLIWIVFLN